MTRSFPDVEEIGQKSDVVITTIQIGQNPANQIRLASPLVNKAPLVTSAVSQNKLNVRRPVHLPKATIEDDHGLICKDGCNCAIMNVNT